MDKIQQEIVNSNENKIIVVAGSGSGKTLVLIERLKRLLNDGVNPEKIVAITFTNAAADEIRERLGDKSIGCFVGTIHSYANNLLIASGYSTSNCIEEEDFDKLFYDVVQHQEVLKEVDHLLVDEYQDINDKQYEFLQMINPKNFFVIGDDWQNIYSWRGSNVKYFIDMLEDFDTKVFKMGNNYRSGENIVNYAMRFLYNVRTKIPKKVICMNEDSGIFYELNNFDVNFIVNKIKKSQSYSSWFILTRTNDQITLLTGLLKEKGIPTDTFKKGDLTSEDLKERLKQDTVKILTAHSAKGLENENVVVYGLKPYNDEECRLAYVAATRAKHQLIWCKGNIFKKRNNKNSVMNWE